MIDAFAETWLPAIARTTLRTLAAAALAWMLLTRLRITAPRVHRIAWALVIAQGWLLVPWTIQFEVADQKQAQAYRAPVEDFFVARESVADEVYESARSTMRLQAAPRASWYFWAATLWAVGAVIVVARYVKNYAAVLRQLPLGQAPDVSDWRAEWETARRRSGIRRRAHFRITENLGPLLCYIPFAYLLLAPRELWSDLEPQQRRAILRHELAHLARGDLWWSAAIRLVALPQWFNPAVWWAVRRFDEAGEWACDDAARRATGADRSAYAKALLRAAEFSTNSLAGAAAAQGGVLSRRIERLINPRFKEEHVMRKMIVPTLLLALATVQVIRFEAVAGKEESSPAGEAQTNDRSAAAERATEPVSSNRVAALYHAGLLPYRVSPPDVLLIRLLHAQPKAELKLIQGDVVQVTATGAASDQKLERTFKVDDDGQVMLHESTGLVKLAGLTPEECVERIAGRLADHDFSSPTVKISFMTLSGVDGKHRIGPGGKINLGRFGTVAVMAMTVDEVRAAIQMKLVGALVKPEVYVDVAAENSAAVYVCLKGFGEGDHAFRLICEPGMRLLDAIAHTDFGMPVDLNAANIHVSRPDRNSGLSEHILPVDWKAISQSGDTATNYPLLPGDRILITSRENVARVPSYAAPRYAGPTAEMKRKGLAPYGIEPPDDVITTDPRGIVLAAPLSYNDEQKRKSVKSVQGNEKRKSKFVIECRFIYHDGNGHPCVLRTPRMRVFNGQEATIVDKTQSPFVVATREIKGVINIAHEPVIEVLTEGMGATAKVSRIDDEWIRLNVAVEESRIEDRDASVVTGTTTVQAPRLVSETTRMIKTIRLGEVVEFKLGKGSGKSTKREFHLVVTKDGFDDPDWESTAPEFPNAKHAAPTR